MRKIMLLSAILIVLPEVAATENCANLTAASPTRSLPAVMAPFAAEMPAATAPVGVQRGVLSRAFDESLSVDNVLLRQEIERCEQVAQAARAQTAVSANDPAAYVKQTEFDNTPYRFSMTQEGRRMTADDFDAWLQANGYSAGRRVAPNEAIVPNENEEVVVDTAL